MLTAIGDLHVDSLRAYIPNACDLILKTMTKVYEAAREEGHKDIFLLGDIYDSAYPEDDDRVKVLKFLRKNNDLRTHVLMGNHDHDDVEHHSLRSMEWLFETSFLNGKVYRKPTVVKIAGERYFVCPHPYVEDQPKNCRYSFGHFGFTGAKGDNGFVIRSGHEPKGRWLLGDYHTAQRGKRFLYPGSLCQVKFHEAPKKFYLTLDEAPKLVRIRPELRLGRVTLSNPDDLAALEEDVFYSANVTADADLPPDWATQYPNVVRHHTEKKVSKAAQILMAKVASDDPLEGLDEFLRNEGLTDKQVKRGYALIGA